ncbi:corticotropin-releasing factor receptor 1-like isoform X3 [Rhincodon typus]|uniref:corticotropin-releasing factor receptor 1-like isoform X3 n=2 Tax=Rhincodon typus TaxID=259920 RepID=UPI00202E91E3|nr:corticotropin-releasing factor receptor 1-like isoform X3 [Rhincodon typus]
MMGRLGNVLHDVDPIVVCRCSEYNEVSQVDLVENNWNCKSSSIRVPWLTGPYCNSSTDLIGTCWHKSPVGQLVTRPCPEYFNGIQYNTTMCSENASEMGLGQAGSTTPSANQSCSKRSIRCLRNIIHWNLISTFILRNATWFVLQKIDPRIHASNKVWCRLVTAVYNYFCVTNFFWMFGEGCYLHTAIVLTYSTNKLRKWMFLCIGWCIPLPIIMAWSVAKLYYENEQCWFGKRSRKHIDYIYQGPVILVLLINFIFLFNIVRILMTKLRASTTSETMQYRKAVKATLVLLPLLGITYMLFFVNPGEDDISQIVFIYFNSFLQSFQGFFVSIFYCFLNGEVRSAVRKRWHRWQDNHWIQTRVARAMSIPTSPTRVSFQSIKQTTAV